MLTMLMSDDVAAVKEAVDATSGLVRDHATEIDQTRRLPAELVSALRRTGIYRLLLPTALGGSQPPVADLLDVVEQIAAVDGSTAWCAVIGAGSNVFAGYLPEGGARQCSPTPTRAARPCSRPSAARGRRGQPPAHRALAVHQQLPAQRLDRPGLARASRRRRRPRPPGRVRAGCGAHDRGHVGRRRAPGHRQPRRRRPGTSVVELDWCCAFSDGRGPRAVVAAPALHGPRAAAGGGPAGHRPRRARRDRPPGDRGPRGPAGPAGRRPALAGLVRHADTRLRGPAAALREAVEEAHDRAERDDPSTGRCRPRSSSRACTPATPASTATSVAHQLGGGAAAYRGNPLLRALDDVQAARQHLLFSHKHLGELAKALVGLDVNYPPFIR